MRNACIAFALLLAACGPAATSTSSTSAAARLEPLSAGGDARFCTGDGAWCVATPAEASPHATQVQHVVNGAATTIASFSFSDEFEHAVWPQIIRAPSANGGETVLIGLTQTETQAYSGGGGSATTVALYELSSNAPANAAPNAVLIAPLGAALDLRACFSEADTRARRDACSDQYNFTGTLTLDASAPNGPPRLILTTEATTFPGVRTRSSDSTQEPPLGPDDLKTVRDETCSYRRVFTRGADGLYTPDQPLPPCEDYLQP